MQTNRRWNGWVEVYAVSGCTHPFERKDLAPTFASHMTTPSLMNAASVNRATYHHYRQELDKRLRFLFNLTGSTHRELMEEFSKIPPGETRRLIRQLNELFKQNKHAIAAFYLLQKHSDIHFHIPETCTPFETREALIRVGRRAWMEYSKKIAQYTEFTSAEILRFFLAVSRNLPKESLDAPLLCGLATGELSLATTTQSPTWATFKFQWNAMNGCQQAIALLALGRALQRKSIDSLEHPAVSSIRDFMHDETVTWANPAVKNACLYVFEERVKLIQTGQSNHSKCRRIVELLKGLAHPLAQKTAIARVFSAGLSKLTQKDPYQPSQESDELLKFVMKQTPFEIPEKTIALLDLKTSSPCFETIAYLLLLSPKNNFVRARFKDYLLGWRDLPLREQAQHLFFFLQQASIQIKRHPINGEQITTTLREFLENDCLGWKDPRIQEAYLYLMGRFGEHPSRHDNVVVEMLKFIACPHYEDFRDDFCQLLSNLVKCAKANSGVKEAIEECATFFQKLSKAKQEEYSVIEVVQEQAEDSLLRKFLNFFI